MISQEKKFTFSEKLIPLLVKAKGKADKDLLTHSLEVEEIAEKILGQLYISPKLNKLARIGIDDETLKEAILLHTLFHDLGKLDTVFQERRERGESTHNRPHALLGLPLVKHELDRIFKEIGVKGEAKEILTAYALLSVATHHSDYHADLYRGFADLRIKLPLTINETPFSILRNSYEKIEDYLEDRYLFDNGIPKRHIYVLFNGTLRLADWLVSGEMSLKNTFVEYGEPQRRVNEYFDKKGWKPREYQLLVSEANHEAMHLRLPTGDGKTETALMPRVNPSKLIYTLPTVTTVESMRLRFEDIFGKQNVSFSHHLLYLTLFEEDRIDEKLSHRYHLKKVVVTTIDRVLLSLMNYRHYQLLEIALNNAYLVVDEIHSYSPFTLSLIFDALEYLREYHNTKILVMSATLPKILEDELKERIGSIPVLPDEYVEKRYKSKQRVRIHVEDEYLINQLDKIRDYYRRGYKVLVVANTVNRAREIYELLKNKGLEYKKDIILIHSRFNLDDRNEKNKLLEELKRNDYPFVLIATQVVEVSLDIDFDVMFTEVSPFDSLVQRCGRVNRRGIKGIMDVFVCNVENVEKPYPYYGKDIGNAQITETLSILENFDFKTEFDFLLANDKYYSALFNIYESELGKNPIKNLFLNKIHVSRFGERIATRDTFMTVQAIPVGKEYSIYSEVCELMDKMKDIKEPKKRDEIRVNILKKIVNVPFYVAENNRYGNNEENYKKYGFVFVELDYDSEVGIKELDKKAIIF